MQYSDSVCHSLTFEDKSDILISAKTTTNSNPAVRNNNACKTLENEVTEANRLE